MTDRRQRPVVPGKGDKRTCAGCRNLLPVDRSDRFAFDNYSDCCAEDGEGHSKTDPACEKYGGYSR